MSTIIDGKQVAKRIFDALESRINEIKNKKGFCPGLAIVQVGSDKSSSVYVNMIIKKCEKVGINATLFEFKENVTTKDILNQIDILNDDDTYCGIIVQFPLPKEIDAKCIREAIHPSKDVDSAGSRNIGKFYASHDGFIPCTPKSMHKLLKEVEPDLSGKHAVIIGRSHVVGKPIADILLNENMTTTVCHSKTKDLAYHVKHADVIMAATGKANLITADMVKKDVIIIDAGISVVDGKIYGDVAFEGMVGKVKAITPVPGGVGPLTIAMLIDNVIEAYDQFCATKKKSEN